MIVTNESMNTKAVITSNLVDVQQRIANACKKSGRTVEEVSLISVSKTKPIEMIQIAYDQGMRVFGENKVQELCDKYEKLASDIQWHLIGHLQRNKVKYIVDKVTMIHSVDSVRLAEQIELEARKKQVDVDVLIEVNVAGEDTKFGVTPEETLNLVTEIAKFPHVHIKGLMTIAPYVENPEENRVHFKKLKELSIDIKSKNIDNVCMNELSMGMTNDYEVAVEEGATFVRVGTGIFGERDYSLQK